MATENAGLEDQSVEVEVGAGGGLKRERRGFESTKRVRGKEKRQIAGGIANIERGRWRRKRGAPAGESVRRKLLRAGLEGRQRRGPVEKATPPLLSRTRT
eukprot:1538197-Rhodomonas_salina.3